MQEFRVIVQINDRYERLEEAIAKKPATQKKVRFEENSTSNLQVLNNRTLLLRTTESQTMRHYRFDHVGFITDSITGFEVDEIMDQLLLERQPCVLMYFKQLRICQINFLMKLLIFAVDKRLKLLNLTLNSIKLDSYIDVREHDLVNLLTEVTTSKYRRNKKPKNIFHNLRELHHWLECQYYDLWLYGKEHECIDFTLTLTDLQKHTFEVQLSVLNMYLDLMDAKAQTMVGAVLENHKKDIRRGVITDFIKDYYTSNYPLWSIYMLFDVPVVAQDTTLTENMLRLASAAYFGMSSLKLKAQDSSSLTSQFEYFVSSSTKMNSEKDATKTQTANLPEEQNVGYLQAKIDEKFKAVIAVMQKYYEHKFGAKIGELCYEIKNLVYERLNMSDTMDQYKMRIREERQKIAEEYYAALIDFRDIDLNISQSSLAMDLNEYFEAKKYDLRSYALQYKVQQLTECQTSIKGAIGAEISMLSNAIEY